MTYTRQQIIERVTERFRLFNSFNPGPLVGGLTERDHEIIGEIVCALKEDSPSKFSFLHEEQEHLFIGGVPNY